MIFRCSINFGSKWSKVKVTRLENVLAPTVSQHFVDIHQMTQSYVAYHAPSFLLDISLFTEHCCECAWIQRAINAYLVTVQLNVVSTARRNEDLF